MKLRAAIIVATASALLYCPCSATNLRKILARQKRATATATNEELVLSQSMLLLSRRAAEVSILSSVGLPQETGHDYYRSFLSEPDKAVVVGADGYCFVGFRETTASLADVEQNLGFTFTPACNGTATDPTTTCCPVRAGYNAAYNAPFRGDLEVALDQCLTTYATCTDNTTCTVLTGFSQGGAIAAVAALHLAALNPYVISFGQPPTVHRDFCPLIASDRWYRYVNTHDGNAGNRIGYDFASMSTALNARHVGHMILFPADHNSTGYAYLGRDLTDYRIRPSSIAAHFMADSYVASAQYHPGYVDHIRFLLEQGTFPVALTGYVDGSLCTQNRECASGSCGRTVLTFWKPPRCR